jgi:hypothetical protein
MPNTRSSDQTNVVYIMHLNTSCCHLFILFHLRILGHGHAELESKELIELVPPEETNPELTEGKPGCIPLIILDFCFNHYFIC